jgi:hypothetical protein
MAHDADSIEAPTLPSGAPLWAPWAPLGTLGAIRVFVLLKRDCLYCCCGTPNKNRGATAYDHGFWLPRTRLVDLGTDGYLPCGRSSR